MSMTVVRELSEDTWRQFVETHPHGNIFHTPEMFQVFTRTQGYEPELWAVSEGEQVLAFMLPVRITLMNGPLRHLTSRAVAHGGVLYTADTKGLEALSVLLDVYTQKVGKSRLFTTIYGTANLPASQQSLFQHGFFYEPSLNYLIDLNRSPEEILQNMQRRTRQKIRRGLNLGEVVIEEISARDDVAVLYDLVRQSCDHGKHALADLSLFESTFDVLRPKGMALLTLARVGDTPVAASVDLPYKDVVFGWYGGMDRNQGRCAANELILWNVFRWGAESGYRIYDFGGAGLPDEQSNVSSFKAKFGAELVYLGRNTRVHTPMTLQCSKLGYSIYQKFLGLRK